MIFEGFAPGTAQELDRLRALRSRVLALFTVGGSVCALIRAVLLV